MLDSEWHHELTKLCNADADALLEKKLSYGDSWKKRGGIGAFMMLARKWDRIENLCKRYGFDIFKAVAADPSNTGILDDIRDLRRYLVLVEDHTLTVDQPVDADVGGSAGPGYTNQG